VPPFGGTFNLGEEITLRKIAYIMGLLMLVSLALWGCGGNVAATVNGEKIMAQELDEEVALMKSDMEQQGFKFEGEQGQEFEQMLRADILNQMVDQKLVLQDAKNRELLPSDKEVKEEIDKLKKQLGADGDFKKFLAANGINEPKLEDFIKQQLALEKLQAEIASGVQEPTEQEINDYYNNNKEQFSQPEQRQVSHILIGADDYSNGKNRTEVEAKVLALQVVEKLNAGADFSELAKQYSDDPGSKDNGGQYPLFSRGSGFVQEFEEAAFNMQEGDFTAEPVKTEFGFHIIRLDQVVPTEVIQLSDAKETIVSNLKNNAISKRMADYMQDLRDKAEIVNNIEKESAEQKDDESSTKQ